MKSFRKPLATSIAAFAAILTSATAARAATGDWNIDANTTGWGNSANWLGGIVPDAIDDVANFSFNLTAARTINTNGIRTVGAMTVGDPTTTFFGYTFTANGQGGALVFDTSAGNANLTLSAASTAGTAFNVPIVLNDPLAIHALNAASSTFNGNISGTGGLLIDASGTHGSGVSSTVGQLLFTGINSFSGGIAISEARTQFSNAYSLGSGTVTVNDGGQAYLLPSAYFRNNFVLNTTGWNETAQGSFGAIRSDATSTLAGSVTLASNSRLGGTGGTMLVNGVIGETGGPQSLEINRLLSGGAAANSTWVFNNTNTYTGGTTVYSGTLRIGNGGTTGSLGTTSGLSFANATVEFRRSDNVTVSTPFTQLTGTIGGVAVTGSSFVHSGTGTLTLDNASSGYLGSTTVNGLNAKLVLGSGGAYAFPATGNVAISNGADLEFNTSSDIQIGGGAKPAAQVFTAAVNSFLIQSGTGTLTLGGTGDNTNGRAIVNSGTLVLNKETDNTKRSLGASNELGLIINGGTLRYGALAHNDQIFSQTDVQINGGTFDLNGKTDSFDVLGGNGGIVTNGNATAAILTLGEQNSALHYSSPIAYNAIYGGVIQDGTGTMAITKIGTGLQTLSGVSSYTGGTSVNAGTLSVTGSLSATGAVNVNNTGTLSGTGSVGAVTMAAGGRISPGSTNADTSIATLTLTSLVVNGGDLRLNLGNTSDAIVVTGTASFAAASTITPTFGTLPTTGTTPLLTATGGVTSVIEPTLNIPFTTRSTFALSPTATSLDLVISGPEAKSLVWTGAISGAWDLNTTANFDGSGSETFFNLDSVTFGDGPSNRTITLSAGVTPSAVAVQNSLGNDYTFQTGSIAGGGTTLSKTGAGTLNLNTANTYGGRTTISGGVVKLGNAAGLGDVGGGTVISGVGTLDLNAVSIGNEPVTISGTGAGGQGTIINSSTTTISELRFLTLAGNATIGGPGRYDIGNGNPGYIDLAGFKLTKVGNGIIYLADGANVAVSSGDIDVQAGTLGFASSYVRGTGTITYNPGTTAFFSTTSSLNLTRDIVVNNAAFQTQSTTSSVGSNVSLAGDLLVNDTGGALTLTGVVSESVAGRSILKSGASTITLAGNNTFTGGIASTGGTININGTNAITGPISLTGSTLTLTETAALPASLGTPSALSLSGSSLRYVAFGTHTLPPATLGTTNTSTVTFAGQTPDALLTINSTLGTTTAFNTLAVEVGKVTLASGAGVTVATTNVGLSAGASGNVGTLAVQPGASLTTGTLYIGEGGAGRSGVVNQSGGTVNVLGTEGTVEGAFRIGHWDGTGSTYNLSGGTLNVPNSTSSIGIDGINALFNISGGTALLNRLVIDGRSTTNPIGGTLNFSGGELSIGTGGLAANGSSQANWTGGTLSSFGFGTWSAPLHLTGAGQVIDTKGTNVLLSGALTGSSGFTKTGNGTLTMSNAAVALAGPLTVTGGTLAVTGLFTGIPSTTVNAGGAIAASGNGTTTGRLTDLFVNAGGIVRPGSDGLDSTIGTLTATNMTFTGGVLRSNLSPFSTTTGGTTNDLVSVTGALTLNGGTLLPLWTTPPSAGVYTLMSAGTLTVNALPTLGTPALSRLTTTVGTSGNALTLDVSGSTLNLIWSGNPGTNTWDHNNSLNWQNFVADDESFFAYDNVSFDDVSSTASTVNLVGTLLPGFVTVDTAATYTFSGTGSMASGTLTKRGTGTLLVTNDNTMTGLATVEAGALQLGDGGATGSIGNVSITNLGTVTFNRSGVYAYGNGAVISGFGSVLKDGNGTVTLTGSADAHKHTYTGGTTVNAGVLSLVGNDSPTGVIRGDVTINTGGTLRLLSSNAIGYGSGVKVNTININGGTLEQASAGDNGWGTTFNLTGGTMSSNGGVTTTASQYFSFGGDNTVGSTRINVLASPATSTIAGRLNLRGGGPDGTNHFVTVADGAAQPDLLVSASLTQAVANAAFVKTGPGTLLYTGTTGGGVGLTASEGLLSVTGTVSNAPAALTANGTGILEVTTTNGFGGTSASGLTGAGIASRPGQKTASAATATGSVVTVGSTADLKAGMTVTTTNVTAGTRILNVLTATTFELSAAVTGTGIASAAAINFGPAPMLLNGGTFRYSGPAATDDRIINVTTQGGTIDASGTGALTLNGNIGFNGEAGARTVMLGGTSTSGNVLIGVVADNSGATSVRKTGTGAWRLGGTNTYTGGTTVSTGELRLSAVAALGTGTVTVGDALTGSSPVSLYIDNARVPFVTPVVVSSLATGPVTLGSRATVTGASATNYFQNVTLERDVIFDSNAADRTDYRAIGGTGNILITGTGRSIFTAVNTFIGNVTVATTGAGFFQVGTANAGNFNFIPDTSDVIVNAGTRFAVSVGGETIDALSGAGLVNVNSINAVLTVGADGGSGDFSGVIANAGQTLGITKIGSGVQTLSGLNTYTGLTTVTDGTLAVTGSISGSVTTVAGTAAVLTGTGTIGALTLNNGTLTAGAPLGTLSTGTLATGTLALNGGTAFFDLAGTLSDSFNVTGSVAFNAPIELALNYTAPLVKNTVFTLINNDFADALNTDAGGFAFGGVPIAPGIDFTFESNGIVENFQLSYTGGDGNDAILTVVPEPGAALSLLGGLGILFTLRRRKQAGK